MTKVCGYLDHSKVHPGFQCPPCAGELAFRVRGYWMGEARRKHGPDMLLCEAHGTWMRNMPTLGMTPEPRPRRGA